MLKKVIIYIINFFLIICVLGLSSLLIFSNTVLNKQYVIKILEKNNYYEKTYYNIQDGFKNYIMQSGLEEDILQDLYDIEKVNKDINMVIDAIYENKDINIDTQELITKLDDRINSVLEDNNHRPDFQEKEEIKIFEDTIAQVYVDGITYFEDDIEQIANIYSKIQLVITKVELALSGLTLLLLGTIIIINRNVKETLNIVGITLLSIGSLNLILKILLGDRTHNILILNSAFSQTLIDLINSIVNVFFTVGIVTTILGIGNIILSKLKKKDKE